MESFSSISSIDASFESTFDSVDEERPNIQPQSESKTFNDLIEKIILLYLKHNLTLVCLEDIMKLLNEVLEECKRLPTGKVQIMNLFRLQRDLMDVVYYLWCNKCRKYSKANDKICAKCIHCDSALKFTETNYFVNLPIEHQIIKSVKENWTAIQKFELNKNTDSSVITDVHDGVILKKVIEKYEDSDVNVLSLTINVDGANKFKSNSKSVWPIQLIQNYLPPNIRFLPKNIIVTGLQYVSCKDDNVDGLNFREFLLPLISELKSFKERSINIEVDTDIYSFKPIITHAAVDLPAKSKLSEMTQFGGYDSCSFCEIHGELIEVPKLVGLKKPATKKYPENPKSVIATESASKTFVRYVEDGDKSHKIRDPIETLQKMLLASESNGQTVLDGTKGISCMAGFEHFDVVWSLSVEYMHLCLLGAAKRFGNFLFNSKHSRKGCYIPPKRRDALNKIIMAIKPTSEITRKPRSINQRSNYKASEYRSLLLYYLPVVLQGYVPNVYLKHIRLLSAAVYKLLQKSIPVDEVDEAEKMLLSFVKEHQQLFGKENMVTVIHLLKHMAESVRKLGPMWSHSAFPFERNNGRLLKWVNGTSDVVHQISSKYILSKATSERNLKPDSKNQVLLGKKLSVRETATHVFSTSSLEILNFSNINLFVHLRVQLKNIVYTSIMYTRPKRSIDYFIGLDTGWLGTAKYYFETNGRIFVMMNQFSVVENIYHILKVKPTNRLIVAPVDEICKKYLYIKIGLNSYVVSPPNPYEKE